MGLSIADFTTQLAALTAQYGLDSDETAYAAGLADLYAQYDSVGTLSEKIAALLAIKTTLLEAYQAGIGLKGTVALVSDLPGVAADGDGWVVARTGHLYARVAGAWVDLGQFALAEWHVVTANYAATAGERITANTAGGSFTITLPAGGGDVQIRDVASCFGTHALTVAGNGRTIVGASTFGLDAPGFVFTFSSTATTWNYGLVYRYGDS